MAPTTKADAQTVQKMVDIKRTIWMNATHISVTPGQHKPKNRRPNRNIRINRSIELMPCKLPNMDEPDTKIFISDPWNLEAANVKKQAQRDWNGQGPIVGNKTIKLPSGENVTITLLSPTRKHWNRSDRRRKASLARAARRRNEMAAKS